MKLQNNLSEKDIINLLRRYGYHDISVRSPENIIVFVQTRNLRDFALDNIRKKMNRDGISVSYDKQEKHLFIEDKFEIKTKELIIPPSIIKSTQNNEQLFEREINVSVQSSLDKSITLQIENGADKFVVKNVVGASESNGVVLVQTKNGIIPISIKKDYSEQWEVANSYWGAIARRFIDAAVENKKIELNERDGIFSISTQLAIKSNIEEKESIVFGKNILELNGCVIRKTFTVNNFKFNVKNNVLTVYVSKLFKNLTDITGPDDVWFVIKNDIRTADANIGYPGITVLAMYQKSVSGRIIKLPRDYVE